MNSLGSGGIMTDERWAELKDGFERGSWGEEIIAYIEHLRESERQLVEALHAVADLSWGLILSADERKRADPVWHLVSDALAFAHGEKKP